MELSEILHADEILRSKALSNSVTSLTDDSRKAGPGAVFFAIRGSSFDGHALAQSALDQGAAFVVIEDPKFFEALERVVLVSSTRKAYAVALSRTLCEPSRAFRLVGVTGTNGKTTTTYLLNQIAGAMGRKTGLIGTVETRIGDRRLESALTTPGPSELQSLFAQMRQESVTDVAMEVSSIALDQFRTAGTTFAAAVFTNLTQDHLDYHGSFENYACAKQRLFEEYAIGFSVLNSDDPFSKRLSCAFGGKVLTYGLDEASDFRGVEYAFDRKTTAARIATPEGEFEIRYQLLGVHNLYNVLGAVATLSGLGNSMDRIVSTLSQIKGAPGRLERVEIPESGPTIFVDYAHTPDALDNVLRAVRRLRGEGAGNIITVFGCGGDRDRLKRPLMAKIASELSDVVVVTSDNPRTEVPNSILNDIEAGIPTGRGNYHREVNRREAIFFALRIAKPQDFVLIAGKGHETYQIIGREKFPFDDRQVAIDFFGLK